MEISHIGSGQHPSGSLDWNDLQSINGSGQLYSLIGTVMNGMTRELLEESVPSGNTITGSDIIYLKVIGYFKNLSRGALPGFCGIARIDKPSCEVFPNHFETVEAYDGGRSSDGTKNRFQVNTPEDLKATTKMLLTKKEYLYSLSLPLFANLHFLLHAMDDKSFCNELYPNSV